jgi:anti-sigma-K factor RskA
MDCDEIRDLLDAYALGAADPAESVALEEHVADCVRCWEELTKSQQTAAMLALAIPIETPPDYVERRVMAQAEVQRPPAPAASARGGLLGRLRLGWPATAGALAVTSVVALVFAAALQVQLDDVRGDNDLLETQQQSDVRVIGDMQEDMSTLQVQLAGVLEENDDLQEELTTDAQVIDDLQEIMTVAFSEDLSTTELVAGSAGAVGVGTVLYGWSRKYLSGFIICHDLPPLADDSVYQAWFRSGENVVSAATFTADEGTCHVPVQLSTELPLTGFGISIEPAGGSASPSSDWLMYASVGE